MTTCSLLQSKCYINIISSFHITTGGLLWKQLASIYAKQLDEAFKKAFMLMQYFAVGMHQILLDITLYEGRLLSEFRHLEECLYQILCEVQLGMHVRGVVPDRHVLHEAMSHEFRDLRDGTQRNLRDFLILRDYIKALDFVQQLFTYLKIREQESRDSK